MAIIEFVAIISERIQNPKKDSFITTDLLSNNVHKYGKINAECRQKPPPVFVSLSVFLIEPKRVLNAWDARPGGLNHCTL